ncbi:MAG TPA: glycosyltransferase family 4 protein, partial [Candidatus Methylomirabilis sp.]|nr:glycosyltransferase family 4 protein [Candidatus Methylomirabilis sp.]
CPAGRLREPEAREGVAVRYFPRDERGALAHLVTAYRNCRAALRRLGRDGPVELLSTHLPLAGFAAIVPPRPLPVPAVINFQAPWDQEFRVKIAGAGGRPVGAALQAFARRVLQAFTLRRSEGVLCLSAFMREEAAHLASLRGKRVAVIPGGVDCERFAPASEKAVPRASLGLPQGGTLLLTVRRLTPRMGLEHLLQAFREVAGDFPQAHLLLAGEGPLRGALEGAIRQAGLAERARLLGFVPEEDLPVLYQAADLFVLPTAALEGFGMATLEALASGLPVLATPVGGTLEILQDLPGPFLTKDASPAALARGLRHFLAMRADERAVWGLRCREYAAGRYAWECVIPQLEAYFAGAIRQRGNGTA